VQNVFVRPSGQDDNLGDSILRVGLLEALRGPDRRLHLLLDEQSSDYLTRMPLGGGTVLYSARQGWLHEIRRSRGSLYVMNAGEINPNPEVPYPNTRTVAEARGVLGRGGAMIAAGLGVKDPASAARVTYDGVLRDAALVSWRDRPSREAAGFGGVAPDWGFALGSGCLSWVPSAERRLLVVTLRFDRPWPEDRWLRTVRDLAARTHTRIVTVAQVARDSPRAVRLAEALGGEYLVAPTTRHDDLEAHVRSVYARSLAVVSDRAHALIIGATEGAYPIGSATDPQKIRRLLDVVGLGSLTGHHDGLGDRTDLLASALPGLASAIESARTQLEMLTNRIRDVMRDVADDEVGDRLTAASART